MRSLCIAAAIACMISLSTVQAQSFNDVTIPYVQYKNRPDLPPIRFQQGRAEEGGRTADAGTFYARIAFKPVVSPLVMLMHGCGGLKNTPTEWWIKSWSSFFWDRGYSVMVVDSFATRGVSDVCGAPNEHWSYRRRDDAFSALDWLATQGKTDMSNVVLMGRSNGGNVALRVLDSKIVGARKHHFKQSIAMYPWCKNDVDTSFLGSLAIFIGEDDDANKAIYCKELAAAGKPNVKVTIYPSTYHGFDDGTKYRVDHGWRMGYNPDSTSAARREIDAFIRR
jgi:dienelactone hydrolase